MMSIFAKLLVPVDGSDPSNCAVQLAIDLARDQHAEILFIHVCEVGKIAAAASGDGAGALYAIAAERQSSEQIVRVAVEAAQSMGVQAQSLIEQGSSVDRILDAACRRGVDLIVIGSHGRGGIARALMGSVAEDVLRRSEIPVLVTRSYRVAGAALEEEAELRRELEVDPIC